MEPLQRALIEKAGHDHGFEHVLPPEGDAVRLASARHRAQAVVTVQGKSFTIRFSSPVAHQLPAELARSYPAATGSGATFVVGTEEELRSVLRRAAALARALPNQAAADYQTEVNKALAQLAGGTAKNTEVERVVRQRVGQQAFREAMLEYWHGACAVTGVALPGVLRASHAKPWAECDSDAERLDVFNGFLLTANLDALFDRFLITFDDEGVLIVSQTIPEGVKGQLGLDKPLKLRWVAKEHLPYLVYHRKEFSGSHLSSF